MYQLSGLLSQNLKPTQKMELLPDGFRTRPSFRLFTVTSFANANQIPSLASEASWIYIDPASTSGPERQNSLNRQPTALECIVTITSAEAHKEVVGGRGGGTRPWETLSGDSLIKLSWGTFSENLPNLYWKNLFLGKLSLESFSGIPFGKLSWEICQDLSEVLPGNTVDGINGATLA